MENSDQIQASCAPQGTNCRAGRCPDAAHMGEFACNNPAQCWEPCGALGKDPATQRVAKGVEYSILPGCGACHKCLQSVTINGLPATATRMILCPECGNKRCPKATDHRLSCTGSNESGQAGSIYGTALPPGMEALQRVQAGLLKAGAQLPIAKPQTIDDGVRVGLSMALLAVEQEMGIHPPVPPLDPQILEDLLNAIEEEALPAPSADEITEPMFAAFANAAEPEVSWVNLSEEQREAFRAKLRHCMAAMLSARP